ncbi:MAG: T9SS type A sorting domain-containing protein [Cyclobacteriaceae bacterium]|nr:T9SS type A sorting domain-containing protein [Cyclobacteriaceae bacterium]MDH5250168.1 T9SS type A sorting domain-containing protein [Cyclobacteriaceae bacterium]
MKWYFILTAGILLNSLRTTTFACISNFAGQPDATSVLLHWTPFSGTEAFAEYRVQRNGVAAGSTIGRYGYFTDFGLNPNTAYSYLVEVLGLNGNVICQSNSIDVTTTSHSTIKTHYKVLAIVFNPNGAIPQSELDHGKTFLNYRIDFLRYASHNSVNLDIYNNDFVIIESPPPLEQNSTAVDYVLLASATYPELSNNNMIDLIERYDIDLVWVLGAPPGHDFGENKLMGNRSLGNETWISEKVKCSRSFFIHSNSPDARAFDAAAHHVEGTMTSATEASPANWPRDKEYLVYTKDRSDYSVYPEKLNLFEQFRLTDEWTGGGAYASKGNANCGSSHFLPGSIRNSAISDYTYYDIEAWQRYVDCYADDWLSYPQFSGTPRKINGYDFAAFNNYQENDSTHSFGFGTASFHQWWFNHIPNNPGVSDGKLNNWWPYVYDCNRFDGNAITFAVDGFPVVPMAYSTTNDEYGTEESGIELNWMFWHTNTDFGQRADLSTVSKSQNPEYVRNGQYSMRVDVDVESFSVNGRNDLIYPRFKNAHWQFSNIDSIFFSVKFTSQQLIEGTNPIVRLCKNGNNRIEFIPTHDGLYCDFFKDDALRDSDGWYTFRIPLSGNDSWERNLIGYIDPALSPSDRELAKQQLYENILEDVNYFEISIQLAGSEYWSRGESVVYYIDDLRIHAKDIPVAVELANTREEQNAKNQDEKIFVSVFPVPAEAELHVNIDNKAANEIHVTVINAQGQSVYIGSYSAQMLQPHSISTLGFQTGVYFVQILGNNGALKVVKIIKK